MIQEAARLLSFYYSLLAKANISGEQIACHGERTEGTGIVEDGQCIRFIHGAQNIQKRIKMIGRGKGK